MKHGNAKSTAENDYLLRGCEIYTFVHEGKSTKQSILFFFIIEPVFIYIEAQSRLSYSIK